MWLKHSVAKLLVSYEIQLNFINSTVILQPYWSLASVNSVS
jgi:hypothetical protein